MINQQFKIFLDNHPFLGKPDLIAKKKPPEIFSLKEEHTISSGGESSSDEETFFEQYLEDRPNHSELLEELFSKMQEEEGVPTSEIEREQQWQIAEVSVKVLLLEFENNAMKRMHHDLKSKEHKQQNILEDQKKDKEMMDKVKLGYDKKFMKMDEEIKQTNQQLHILQKLMNTKVSDLHDSAMRRVKQLVKINDNVEVFEDSAKKSPTPASAPVQTRPLPAFPTIKGHILPGLTK